MKPLKLALVVVAVLVAIIGGAMIGKAVDTQSHMGEIKESTHQNTTDIMLSAETTKTNNEKMTNKEDVSAVGVTRSKDRGLINKAGTIWYFTGTPHIDGNSIIFYKNGRWVDPMYVKDTIQGRKGTWFSEGNKLTWIFKGGARGNDGTTFTMTYKIKKTTDGKTILLLYNDNKDTEYVLCEPNIQGSCMNYDDNDAGINVDFKELEKRYK
jgi:hypothetical protein